MTPTDPDPTALELARCVAWLRAREKNLDKLAESSWGGLQRAYLSAARAIGQAAAALERGEQP